MLITRCCVLCDYLSCITLHKRVRPRRCGLRVRIYVCVCVFRCYIPLFLISLFSFIFLEPYQKSHVVAKVTEELQIPNACVGYVIGRGGARVKKLQEENDVKVFFRDRSETDKEEGEGEGKGENMRMAAIVGKPENVARAKSAILAIVEERQSKPEPQTLVISVPSRMVGRIIGKQGSQIRQLQYESKARIVVDHTNSPNTMQTQVTITGQEADIDRACILLKELLEQTDRRPGSGAVPASSQFSAPPFKPRLLPAPLPDGIEPVTVYASAIDEDCCVWVQVRDRGREGGALV